MRSMVVGFEARRAEPLGGGSDITIGAAETECNGPSGPPFPVVCHGLLSLVPANYRLTPIPPPPSLRMVPRPSQGGLFGRTGRLVFLSSKPGNSRASFGVEREAPPPTSSCSRSAAPCSDLPGCRCRFWTWYPCTVRPHNRSAGNASRPR